jgi:hypothetical protein
MLNSRRLCGSPINHCCGTASIIRAMVEDRTISMLPIRIGARLSTI